MMMSACQKEHVKETSQEPQFCHLLEDSLTMSASKNEDLLDISQEPPGAVSLSLKKKHYFSVFHGKVNLSNIESPHLSYQEVVQKLL